MKRIIALLVGIITTIIAANIAILIGINTGFAFESFFFFFIVPVGSIIIGLIAASGYALVLKNLNQKSSGIDHLLALLLGLVAAFLIYFTFYKLTYSDLRPDQISQLAPIVNSFNSVDAGSPDFSSFMLSDISHRQISFSSKGRSIATTPENATIGWIHFIIELLGYITGGFVVISVFINTKFCDNCQIYYKKAKTELEVDLAAKADINKIDQALQHHANIKELLMSIPSSSGNNTLKLHVENCNQCGDGILHLTFNKLKNDGEKEELDKLSQAISLKHFIVSAPFHLQTYLDKISKEPEFHSTYQGKSAK